MLFLLTCGKLLRRVLDAYSPTRWRVGSRSDCKTQITGSPISGLVLAGPILKELGALSELRTLYLSSNELTGNLIWGGRAPIFFSPASGNVSCQRVGE